MRMITIAIEEDLPDDQIERVAESVDQHLFTLIPDAEYRVKVDTDGASS